MSDGERGEEVRKDMELQDENTGRGVGVSGFEMRCVNLRACQDE